MKSTDEHSAGKVQPHHLEREACLYVWQSSLRHARDPDESCKCRHALRQAALEMGWPAERLRVIDEDLGKSGADSAGRTGFKDLLARISSGKVGIVMGLEVSRPALDSADWQRLVHACAASRTLVLDGDGVYDPLDRSDRLMLALKGAVSEVELHALRARLPCRTAAARPPRRNRP